MKAKGNLYLPDAEDDEENNNELSLVRSLADNFSSISQQPTNDKLSKRSEDLPITDFNASHGSDGFDVEHLESNCQKEVEQPSNCVNPHKPLSKHCSLPPDFKINTQST